MSAVTAATVKELRERSGAGMMDCKNALAETNGDIEAAIDWLRSKGLAAAAKKSSRTAAEGLVGVATSANKGAAVEVNSETDFVAKNDQFQDFVRNVTTVALETGIDTAEALLAAGYPNGGTVQDALTNNVATIGENQTVRRVKILTVKEGLVVSYVHNAAAPGLGKIGVLVALESSAGADVLDPDVVARERAIAEETAAESGKPADVVTKMVDGAIAKYRKENALLSQLFVMDGKTPVAEVVAAAGREAGATITLTDYARFQLGEGIEKKETDFAAEVAAAVGAA